MAKILVVDDNCLNRGVLTTLLGYSGHSLLEASSGAEALDKVRLENPELVITDILMPRMDGYEFVRRLHELKKIRQPKVIFYSATYLEEEARALARACGVSSILGKPIDPEKVLKVVDETLTHDSAGEAPPADGHLEKAIRVLSNKLYHKVQELEGLNTELERRVAERTAALENANRSLQQEIVERQRAETEATKSSEERLRMKSEFLSHVSHELRSPLGVVHQFTTILLDSLAGPLTADQREYLEISLRNLNQLKCMIDDLLEASRADVGKLAVQRSSIHIRDVIDQAVKSLRAVAAGKGIALGIHLSASLPLVYADPARVFQILTNLLDNAIKFSPPKTSITLRAELFENDLNFVDISVADGGCGIKPEDADRIFDRLYQGKNSAHDGRQGLGLGLYICKQLVALHGGSLWLNTQAGVGSAFHFTLPVFALHSMIAPLMAVEGRIAPTVTFLAVKVSRADGWQDERQRERALHRVRRLLERCILPDLDVLLPSENCGGAELFSIVARTDGRGAQVLLSRIREHLSNCDDLRSSGVLCLVDSEVFDVATLVKGLPPEKCVACVADFLQGQLKKRKDGNKSQ